METFHGVYLQYMCISVEKGGETVRRGEEINFLLILWMNYDQIKVAEQMFGVWEATCKSHLTFVNQRLKEYHQEMMQIWPHVVFPSTSVKAMFRSKIVRCWLGRIKGEYKTFALAVPFAWVNTKKDTQTYTTIINSFLHASYDFTPSCHVVFGLFVSNYLSEVPVS